MTPFSAFVVTCPVGRECLFKPVAVDAPLDLEPAPGAVADDSLWWRHERLHRAAMCDPARLAALYSAERDAIEAAWLAAPPSPAAAFDEADALEARWMEAVLGQPSVDVRPRFVQRHWSKRNPQAGLPPRIPAQPAPTEINGTGLIIFPTASRPAAFPLASNAALKY